MRGFIFLLVILIALSIGSWYLQRWWHYSMSYESQVKETICETVRHEYLVDPEMCE